MPIYEYQCKACEKQAEFVQKVSSDPKVTCPHCKEDELVRMISAAGFRLKGTGWYETDFKDKKKTETTTTKETESSSDKKTTDKTTAEKSAKTDSASSDQKTTDKKTTTDSKQKDS